MKQMIILGLGSAMLVGAAIAAPPVQFTNDTRHSTARYTIRAIPVPAGFNYAGANDVNSIGEAVGIAGGTSGSQAIMNIAGVNIMLDSLAGMHTWAEAVNDAGQIAGSSQAQPWWGWRAVRWELDGSMTVIEPITGDEHDNIQAFGINNQGQVVGQSDVAGGMWHAFFWDDETGLVDLGTLGGSYSAAADINDAGVVVGWSWAAQVSEAAFVWAHGVMTALPILPGSDFPGAQAKAINNRGMIVGHSNGEFYGIQHAVIWNEGQIRMLGSLGGHSSWATDINDRGVIVGEALLESGERHAFIHENGEMRDLNDFLPANSGWELERAVAISEDGHIVGYGRLNGEFRNFILEPVRNTRQAAK